MPSRINIGPENGPYVAINESSGNLQLEDNSGNVVAEWDETNAQWDFANNTLNNVDALNSNSVKTEVSRTTGTEDITLNVPTDYGDWQSAVDAASEYSYRSGVEILINIESGHEVSENLTIRDLTLPHVKIQSEADTVGVEDGFTGDLIDIRRSVAPVIDTTFDMGGDGTNGIVCKENSMIQVTRDNGVDNAGNDCIALEWNAFADLRGTEWTGAGRRCLDAHQLVSISGQDIVLDNAGARGCRLGNCVKANFQDGTVTNHGSTGLNLAHETDATLRRADISGNGSDGIELEEACRVDLTDADISNNVSEGIDSDTSVVYASGVTVHNNGEQGINTRFSDLRAAEATITENGEEGVRQIGGFASVRSATIEDNLDEGIHTDRGATMDARTAHIASNNDGVLADDSSVISCRDADILNNGQGVEASDSSHINLQDATVDNNDSRGVGLNNGSSAGVEGVTITNNGGTGLNLSFSCSAGGADVTITDNGNHGVQCNRGNTASFTGQIENNDGDDVRCRRGSIIAVHGLTYGDRNISTNTLTSDGVIFE